MPYDVKFPIILPRGRHMTKLIVKYYDETANHSAATNIVFSQISQRFSIISAREEIRSWECECNGQSERCNPIDAKSLPTWSDGGKSCPRGSRLHGFQLEQSVDKSPATDFTSLVKMVERVSPYLKQTTQMDGGCEGYKGRWHSFSFKSTII